MASKGPPLYIVLPSVCEFIPPLQDSLASGSQTWLHIRDT